LPGLPGGSDNLASAELYDPATGTFAPTGPMATGRDVHNATLLKNGQVVITGGNEYYPFGAGGRDPFHPTLSRAELYTPVGPPLPRLAVNLNQATFQQGDTLTVTATVDPGAQPRLVDVYVALRLPDQSVWFLQGDGDLTPTVQPLVHNWPVAALRADLFRYTF